MIHVSKNKKLGQHFLHDNYWIDRIAHEINLTYATCRAKNVRTKLYEIGAGDGALTNKLALLQLPVTAIEIDARRITTLQNISDHFKNIHIIQANILDYNFLDTTKICLVGNLPYNIASQIILRFAENSQVSGMLFLVQRELASRLVATPSCASYGAFTLLTGIWRKSWRIFDIPPSAFDPPPQVHSTLVGLSEYIPCISENDTRLVFTKLVKRGFQQRRKRISNSLAGLLDDNAWHKMEIQPSFRAENLSMQNWIDLAEYLAHQNKL